MVLERKVNSKSKKNKRGCGKARRVILSVAKDPLQAIGGFFVPSRCPGLHSEPADAIHAQC